MDNYNKYIEYKTKYIQLKMLYNAEQRGGRMNIIIHISGVSGAGKTTLGNKLKDKLGSKIVVKDLDDLRDEFVKNTYNVNKSWTLEENKYQQYINDFIKSQNKPIIFVGLNDNPLGQKKIYYNLHSNHKYFIDIDDMTAVKQKCLRLLNDIQNDDGAINDLINNNKRFVERFQKAIRIECGEKETKKMNSKWKKDYKKQGYKFMTGEDIYKTIVNIL